MMSDVSPIAIPAALIRRYYQNFRYQRPVTQVRYAWQTVTVCIAAQCLSPYGSRYGPCTVVCTDARLEDDASGGDVALKMFSQKDWVYLIAGNVALAQEYMAVHGLKAYMDVDCEADAIESLRVGPRLMKERLVKEYLSTRWAIGLEEFRAIGHEHFPPDVYSKIHFDIEQMGIGCEIVATGYADRIPILCTINQYGEVRAQRGFATAGSGALMAQASLFRRGYKWTFPLELALYCVYEAKRAAEYAPGVGKTTNLATWVFT